MNEYQKEFATLIKATLHYLQEEWGEPTPQAPSQPNTTTAKKKEKPSNPTPSEKVSKLPEDEEVKAKVQVPKVLAKWTLNPMPLPTEQPAQFSSFFPTIPLTIPIRLVVTDPSQTFFLENVARALTKLIAPAALFSGKLDTLLTNQTITLILAPLSLLKKRFPQVHLHQCLTFDGPTLLPLADHYDLELKRALWNALKSFPFTSKSP